MDARDEEDRRPQRKKPLIAGTGWLLFVCAFLPTLRVCGDPVAPFMFPPDYVVYLGAAVLAIIAVLRTLRARRAWFTAWFVMWFATAGAWAAMYLGNANDTAFVILVVASLVGAVFAGMAFWRKRHTTRGMWIGGVVHGALSIAWYVLLAADKDAMWGAYVGLVSSILLVVASGLALAQHVAELERVRRETGPAPLPVARVVDRD